MVSAILFLLQLKQFRTILANALLAAKFGGRWHVSCGGRRHDGGACAEKGAGRLGQRCLR